MLSQYSRINAIRREVREAFILPRDTLLASWDALIVKNDLAALENEQLKFSKALSTCATKLIKFTSAIDTKDPVIRDLLSKTVYNYLIGMAQMMDNFLDQKQRKALLQQRHEAELADLLKLKEDTLQGGRDLARISAALSSATSGLPKISFEQAAEEAEAAFKKEEKLLKRRHNIQLKRLEEESRTDLLEASTGRKILILDDWFMTLCSVPVIRKILVDGRENKLGFGTRFRGVIRQRDKSGKLIENKSVFARGDLNRFMKWLKKVARKARKTKIYFYNIDQFAHRLEDLIARRRHNRVWQVMKLGLNTFSNIIAPVMVQLSTGFGLKQAVVNKVFKPIAQFFKKTLPGFFRKAPFKATDEVVAGIAGAVAIGAVIKKIPCVSKASKQKGYSKEARLARYDDNINEGRANDRSISEEHHGCATPKAAFAFLAGAQDQEIMAAEQSTVPFRYY